MLPATRLETNSVPLSPHTISRALLIPCAHSDTLKPAGTLILSTGMSPGAFGAGGCAMGASVESAMLAGWPCFQGGGGCGWPCWASASGPRGGANARRTATEVSVMRSMGASLLDIGSRIRTDFSLRADDTSRNRGLSRLWRACKHARPVKRRALAAVLLGLLGVLPVSAQQPAPTDAQTPAPSPPDQPAEPQLIMQTPGPKPDDPTGLEPVVVTVTRTEPPAGQAPASVTVLTREDISLSPSVTLDDLLRQVPGFSLFRRSSSLVTHPTTQGLSLRGIGPSGTSRALVLVDGVPVNDPFGGWVYWGRIPMLGIDQIEVVRGGGSSVWGNYALGGVVQIINRRPTERALFFDGSYGLNDTMNFDLLLHDVEGPFRISLEGNYFSTGGYEVVKKSRRGSIDIEADSTHSTFNGRVELVATPEASLYVGGS